MDKSQAIYNFWSQFNLPVYDEYAVPDDAVLPYITYHESTGSMEDVLNLYASLWYKSTSWEDASKKADEISKYIGISRTIRFDDGYLYIVRGVPFSQRMDSGDDTVKRVYINIQAEFLSA